MWQLHKIFVTVQYLHTYRNLPRSFPSDAWQVTRKNSFQIGCADGIFVFQIMFSYSQMMGAVSTALIRSRHIHSSLIFLFLKKHMLLQNLRLDLNLVCAVRH